MSYVEKQHRYLVSTSVNGGEFGKSIYTGTFPQVQQHVAAERARWQRQFGFPAEIVYGQVS
jgi:hypothetical protein